MARHVLTTAGLVLLATPALAQLALPVPPPVVDQTVGEVVGRASGSPAESIVAIGRRLEAARIQRIDRLIRESRGQIERDDVGIPSRRGELLLVHADDAAIHIADDAGFSLIERELIAGLEIDVARLAVPRNMTLPNAVRRLRAILPGREISADQLLLPSSSASTVIVQASASVPRRLTDLPVGMIDSGVSSSIPLAGSRGFASGAPYPANHGTAVASLLQHAGVTRLYSADVYGSDPAGGSSLAVARAIGWLLSQRVRVISISLVGSDNALLRRAVQQATTRGAIIVASVGNDGPAAPPAYPASYSQSIAVTAVDRRNRLLIEAGRALHLDYAAPGADMRALAADGRWLEVRGTSYATPLVAARAASALETAQTRTAALAILDREAIDLGRRGPDTRFGRGLICRDCRPAR